MDKIVGILWNKNEGDILNFIISKALDQVDFLLMADDGSTDESVAIMESFKSNPKVLEILKVAKGKGEKKQLLLEKVKQRFKPENTLVQVIESDVTILDTDIRTCWAKYNNNNASMSWQMINATDPEGWKDETGCYPTWEVPIDKKMTHGNWMEVMSHYTFRPLPGVFFINDSRPWPKGLAQYVQKDNIRILSDAPLVAHWGYRGPSHWFAKYSKGPGSLHPKHKWKIGSVEECKANVPFFNGIWAPNKDTVPLSRAGWAGWIKQKWNRD
jgi:hypothetical protein